MRNIQPDQTRLIAENERLRQENQYLQQNLAFAQSKAPEFAQLYKDNAKMKQALDQLNKAIKEEEDEVRRLRLVVDQLTRDLENAKREQKMMHGALTEAKQREGDSVKYKAMIDKLNNDLEVAKQREGDSVKYKAMIDKLNNDLEVAKREQEMMLNAVNDQRSKQSAKENQLFTDNQKMKQIIDSLNNDLKKAQMELLRAKDDHLELMRLKEDRNQELIQRENQQARIQQLETQLRDFMNKDEKSNGMIHQFETQFRELVLKDERQQSIIMQLEMQLQTEKQKSNNADSLRQQLGQLQQQYYNLQNELDYGEKQNLAMIKERQRWNDEKLMYQQEIERLNALQGQKNQYNEDYNNMRQTIIQLETENRELKSKINMINGRERGYEELQRENEMLKHYLNEFMHTFNN